MNKSGKVTISVLLVLLGFSLIGFAVGGTVIVASPQSLIHVLGGKTGVEYGAVVTDRDQIKVDLNKSQGNLTQANNNLVQSKSDLAKAQDDLTKANQKVDSLSCKAGLTNVDFTSNATVSKTLVVYIINLERENHDATNIFGSWDLLWGDSKAASHKIHVTMSGRVTTWIFIVTFNELITTPTKSTWSMHNTIYDVNRECFLYQEV